MIFAGDVLTIDSPLGALTLGVVDPHLPGVAEGVSRLLMRSIQDAREEAGGHLPGWLVDDIERNYISPEKIRSLWAEAGHRFALVLGDEIVGTVHVARRHDLILTVDRHRNNVPASEHPGFKPEGFHHVVNMSVKHELRRAGLARRMFDGIVTAFRGLFAGDGLWFRADPPWHAGLVGLGFEHDPSMDVFLPEDVVRTAGLPHEDFNRLHACTCVPRVIARPEALVARPDAMARKKLQYVSFTRGFAQAPRSRATRPPATPPTSVDDVCAVLAWATREGRTVAIRGRGQSFEPDAGEIVLSTERLTGVGSIEDDRVTVLGGTSLAELVTATSARGLTPPVLTTWTEASVGGVLATGGFGRSSLTEGLLVDHVLSLVVVTGDGRRVACSRTQAAWLFEAVLGGHGCFGVIAEATIRLVPAALASNVAPPSSAFAPTRILQLVATDDTLAPVLDLLGQHAQLSEGDSIRTHTVCRGEARARTTFPLADHELAHMVSFMRELRGRSAERIEDENQELRTKALALGVRSTLQGTIPRTEDEWRAWLGDRHDRAIQAKALADPAHVLGTRFRFSARSGARRG